MFKVLNQTFKWEEMKSRMRDLQPHLDKPGSLTRAFIFSPPFTISKDRLKELALKLGERPSFFFPQNEKINNDLSEKREQPGKKFEHSPDFRTVLMDGKKFTLTGKQAQAVELLYSDEKFPDLGQSYILGEISPDTSTKRLRDIFNRNLKAWKALIEPGERKGTFRLKR